MKKLTKLQKKLASLLGTKGENPEREIAEEIVSMVSTPAAVRNFKFLRPDKVFSKQKVKPIDRSSRDLERENKVLRDLIKKTGKETKLYGEVKKDPKRQNTYLKLLLRRLVKAKNKLN